MKFEFEKSDKKSNDEFLAQLRGSTFCYLHVPTNAEQAETQRRIIREINDFHKPVFIARNNK